MVIKLISLTIAACAAVLSVFGIASPSDPLFLFISGQHTVIAARLLLVLAVVYMAYKSRFNYRSSQYACGLIGGLLFVVCFFCATNQYMINHLSNYIKVFDLILLGEAGLALLLSALTLKAGSAWLPNTWNFKKSIGVPADFKPSTKVIRLKDIGKTA